MATFAAKLAAGLARGQQQQPGGGRSGSTQASGGSAKPAPPRQTVGFSVANERLAFIGNVLIGYKVEVTVTSGLVYEGVFSSLLTEAGGASVVLKFAKVIKDPKATASDRTALAERPVPVMTISGADLVQLQAKDVRMSPEDLSGADRSDVGFETDAAISRGRGGGVRELQRWQPDEGDGSSFFSLETNDGGAGWDQFAVNRERFGVQTTWSEHFYTTKINRDECKISEQDAARIAREIEQGIHTGGVTTNIHLLEERGGELAADVDEEALYGAVIREPAGGAPQQRGQQQQAQQQRPRAPPAPANAWGRAGVGVAVLSGQMAQAGAPAGPGGAGRPAGPGSAAAAAAGAGGSAGGADGGSASGSAGGTAPIDIDPRREVNKVRSSLTVGAKKDRSSPFGTPKLGMSRSPVYASPLVADPVSFSALDLDPGAPQVRLDPDTKAEFLRFKEEMNKKRADATLADLKKSSFRDRTGTSVASNGTAPSGSPPEGGVAAAAAAAAAAGAAGAPADGAAAASGDKAKEANGTDAAKPAAAKPAITSKLNPNAKPFSLNVFAKEFVPSFGAAKPAAAAASTPAAGSTAAAGPSAAAAASGSGATAAGAASAPAAAAAQQHAPAGAAAGAAPSGGVGAGGNGYGGGAGPGPMVSAHHPQGHPHGGAGGHGGMGGPHHGGLHVNQGGQYAHHVTGGLHVGHGQQGMHGGGGHGHERGGYGHGGQGGGPMGRSGGAGNGEHGGGMYHRNSDPYRDGGGGGGGYRGGGGGGGGGDHSYRNQTNSNDGYHHHVSHGKGGGGGDHPHHQSHGKGGEHAGGLHKVPPPPPQGPMGDGGNGQMAPIVINGVPSGPMAPHGMMPMVATPAGMQAMGAVPYGVVAVPAGGYMTAGMPGTVMAGPGGMPIMYAVRPAGGGPTMMAPAGHVAMMGPAPGMAGPYGAAAGGSYVMAAPPGGMPPPSPTTGRPQSTGYFQTAGPYPMLSAASHHGAHPGQMGHGHQGQPGGPHGGNPMMGHGHGPMGHGGPHMQDGRMGGGGGGMGPGGGPKGGGRNMGGGGRPPPRAEGNMG